MSRLAMRPASCLPVPRKFAWACDCCAGPDCPCRAAHLWGLHAMARCACVLADIFAQAAAVRPGRPACVATRTNVPPKPRAPTLLLHVPRRVPAGRRRAHAVRGRR